MGVLWDIFILTRVKRDMKGLLLVACAAGVSVLAVLAFQGGVTAPKSVMAFLPTGGSVGALNAIQAANGSGGFVDSGCNNIGSGQEINCPAVTFNTTRIVTNGPLSCPLFPDNYWINTDASSYPQDQGWALVYAPMYASSGVAFTGATWAAGVASITVASTSTLSTGTSYFVGGAVSSNCLTGQQCGFNSVATSLGNIVLATVTVTSGTTFTYPLTGNPGTWVSGGLIYTTNIRFKQDPAFTLNSATSSTTVLTPATSIWDTASSTNDAGPYPWTSSFFVEGYQNTIGGGYVPQVVSTFTPGGDAHVVSLNFSSCQLYETDFLQNNGSPWHNSNGAIWTLQSNDLRTAHKLGGVANNVDTSGLTSGDVAGLPIWPTVLQYSELFSGNPITHAIRITLNNCAGVYNGFVWPSTHGNGGCNSTPPLGSRWILSPTFDTTTCHYLDCAGLAWPAYMQRLLTAFQHYGVVFADGGTPISISLDASSSWGATDNTSSPTYELEGWLHGIQWTDGYIVDQTQHVVNALSGATK